ncbi:MAG: TIGR03560 family F420-dependent LLM class oxidoreductase [Anaerolineae bacterium]|nr:TIGR03560 family F420-dependent LLM class oxidoreductase [Anaerolineae bacterium]
MQIGIMIEGQDGLNWTRWQRILQTAEDSGYQCVFRSDHFTNADGEDKDSLELWLSLTYAASHTQRIEFGSLVAPVTFRHPSMTVRMASQVDALSGGRLILGLGAGWQEREHRKFGIPFYDFPTRYAMLSDALEMTDRLLHTEGPVSYQGKHFSLDEAQLMPPPTRRLPILIGGNGPTRTLPLVAQYADEWNAVFLSLDTWKERTALLDDLLKEQGRQPGEVKRSLMTQVVYGKDDATLHARLGDRKAEELRERGLIVGTGSAVVDQLSRWQEAGLQRVMLQWMAQDDIDGMEHMAQDVLSHFHK